VKRFFLPLHPFQNNDRLAGFPAVAGKCPE
jgi:hypothetical protein